MSVPGEIPSLALLNHRRWPTETVSSHASNLLTTGTKCRARCTGYSQHRPWSGGARRVVHARNCRSSDEVPELGTSSDG